MSALARRWRRVTRTEPCPVCARPDWCGIAADGAVVRCMRVPSDHASNGGWIHQLGDGARTTPVRREMPLAMPRADLEELARRWASHLAEDRLRQFAAGLGIQPDALAELGLGWTGGAWSFPMRNAKGRVVGIRLRAPGGRKFAVRGGREGCFLPATAFEGPLLFPEGPTDAAALLGLGFAVVGRPSCTGGVRYCVELGRGRECVVVADDDAPGRRGAEALTVALALVATRVRLVAPPAKDVREWVRAGAVRGDVARLIEAAPVRQLRMREVTR